MDMKINVALLKKLRKEKAWSQEELAIASGISLRTIQRIEKDGNASLESKKAVAAAFEIRASDLDLKEDTSPIADDEAENFYFRVEDGKTLSEIIGGAYAYRMTHDNPTNEEEAELLAWAAKSLQDWGDVWEDLGAGDRVKATFELTQLIRELESNDYWIFGVRTTEEYPNVKGSKWPIANICIMRSDNPTIIKLDLTNIT